jgi:FkbM family methyltransferase
VLAQGLQRRCEVHAFEPMAATYQRLGEHIALNRMDGVVHAHQLALSDQPGRASMTQPRSDNSGAAYAELGAGEVMVSTLDAFVQEHGLSRLDFVKIDVEGFEERVLRGGVRTLRTLRPTLLLEVQPVTLERAGSSVPRLFDLLQTMGYVLHRARKERLVPLDPAEVATPGSLVNGFALPTR